MGCQFASNPCVITPVNLAEVSLSWDGPAQGRKAVSFPGRKAIFLDSGFWRQCTHLDGRAAILAHEVAHLEGAKCEHCADRRAGALLREWCSQGIPGGTPVARDARRAMRGELEHRDPRRAEAELAEGFGIDLPVILPMKTEVGWSQGKSFPVTLAQVAPGHWLEAKEVAPAFVKLLADATSRGVAPSKIESSFRSWDDQASLLARFAKGDPGVGQPAPNGWSNHQDGRAVDLSFASDNAREVFAALAETHGFFRDVSTERWHFTHGGTRRFPLSDSALAVLGICLTIAAVLFI